MNRLHAFLRTRIPLQRTDLLPGRHWVWNSFRIKLKKIAAMMIMSGHIVEYNDLNYRNDDECILSQRHNFIAASSEEEDLDGSYLSFDKKRSLHFRSGTAEVGMNRRWKEHIQASMRTLCINRNSKFYSSYPHINCDETNRSNQDDKMGTFQQLEQLIGIGITRDKLTSINALFTWSDEELTGLNNLKGVASRNTLADKKYKHICYLFELAYALAIESRRNISGNPGCEWQLGYFGR